MNVPKVVSATKAHRLSAALCWVILLFTSSEAAQAQRSISVWENDVIADTDRDYTNGVRQSFVFDDFNRDLFAAKVFDFIKPALITAGGPGGPIKQQLEWIAFGQSIFTPDNTRTPVRAPGDRSFAGWLYTGFNAAQETDRTQLDSFEVLVGAVGGPASLAYDVQAAFHRLIGEAPPVINGYELHNEPGLVLAWDRRWKFGTNFGNGFGADIIPAVGVTAGNVYTYASVGALARIGRSLSTTWGPTTVRPAPSGASFFNPDPGAPFLGWDIFAGFEGRAIARNIFLDGNTFQDSIHVTKEPFVLDLIAGGEIFTQRGDALTFTVIQRSREYTGGKSSLFGSVAVSFRF